MLVILFSLLITQANQYLSTPSLSKYFVCVYDFCLGKPKEGFSIVEKIINKCNLTSIKIKFKLGEKEWLRLHWISVILYYNDRRVSGAEQLDRTEMSLSKQTANRANDIICRFFRVTENWDKKLFESVFSRDQQFN